jgi:hypothetical protein
MVLIRIKERDDNQIAKIIGNDQIKIYKNLKLCTFNYCPLDEKIEKRIEDLINNKTESSIDYDNTGDEYTIFGLQQGYDSNVRYNSKPTQSNTYRNAGKFKERTTSNTYGRRK